MRIVVGVFALAAFAAAMTGGAGAAPRLVVGEVTTSTTWGGCAQSDLALDEFAANYIGSLAVVGYHAWWPAPGNDPFYLANVTENTARINYYGADYTPHYRQDGIVDGDASPGIWADQIEARREVPSPLTIVPSVTYDPGTHSGIFTATITNVSDAAVSGKFRMAITESNIAYTGPNGLPIHNFVMRDMVPDAAGQTVSLGIGGNTVINQAYSIDPGWVTDNCQIVAWVQNDGTKEIYQGARVIFPLDRVVVGLAGTEVSERTPGGDGDGYFDAGESGNVVVTLANINLAQATGVSATLTESDPNVTVVDGTSSFGTIPGFGRADNSADPFVLTAASGAPSGFWVDCSLQVTYGSLATVDTFPASVGVGTPTDATGPYAGYYACEDVDPYTQAPTFNWVEIDTSLGGPGTWINPTDDGNAQRRLPFTFRYFGVDCDSVSISSNGFLALAKTFDADASPSHIPDPDGPPGMVAGLWCDLNPREPGSGKIFFYNDTANHRYIAEWNGVHHVGGGSPETFQIILMDPAYHPTPTGDGEIIVQYKTLSMPTGGVAGIENRAETAGIEYSFFGRANPAAVGLANGRVVKYTTETPTGTGVPGVAGQGAGAAVLLAASPNPFTQGTVLRYRLPERQDATLRIYGVDGRLVSTLVQGTAEAGWHEARWDGRDGAGREVASGLYFARLETGSGVTIGKLMVLR